MKKLGFAVTALAVMVLLNAANTYGQDGKKMKDGMEMEAMRSGPHHSMMMAYKQTSLIFARALLDMTKDGKIQDIELARSSFAEIKRSMQMSDEIHQTHMGKMDAEMREKMKSMMESMQREKAAVKESMLALETALQSASPDAKEMEKLAAELVLKLEKNNKAGMKKEMMKQTK